jgi:hypothetical protein
VPSPQLDWEVAVAVVENHWLVLPGNLPGSHAWPQPSEIKDTSIINLIILLPISKDTIFMETMHIIHLIFSFQNIKIKVKEIKHETYITTWMLMVSHITQP